MHRRGARERTAACRNLATDISAPALEVARRNAARHGVADRVLFLQTDLLESVNERELDLIWSPAIRLTWRAMNRTNFAREVREHEPASALFGGEEGYEIYPQPGRTSCLNI